MPQQFRFATPMDHHDALADSIDILELPRKMHLALGHLGVRTVGEARALSFCRLTETPGLGKASVTALRLALVRHLGGQFDPPFKPCPFCGGDAFVTERRESFMLQCRDCGAKGPICFSRDRSITGWNGRSAGEKHAERAKSVGAGEDQDPIERGRNRHHLPRD